VAKEAGTIKCGFYLSVAVSRTNQPFSSSSARGNNFGAGKLCVDSISQVLLFLPLISNLAPAM
jgi:hypothetical protein